MSLRSKKRRRLRRRVERAEKIRRYMEENPVWIPDNPPERNYTCPGCKKGVKCFRIGESSSYLVMDATDEKHEHDCGYEGAIEPKLLGYRPTKGKKDAQPGSEAGGAGSNPASPGVHELDRGPSAEGSVPGYTSPASQA